MHTTRRRFLTLALGTLAVAGLEQRASAQKALRVGVLRSAASLRVAGWVGTWEADGAARLLRSLGLDVQVVSDADLDPKDSDSFGDFDVLVVPGARCVSKAGAARVDAWVRQGGKLLALGMASYRNERNQRATPDNNFQWAGLYGADFQRWLRAWPQCEYLDLEPRLAAEVGAVMRTPSVHRIQLGRNSAMLVRPRVCTDVLATWTQADGVSPTTDSGSASAAIVQNGRVIYCGENLLSPDLSRSPQVAALVLALLRRLDANAPLQVPAALLEAPAALQIPAGPAVAIVPGGPTLRVGLDGGVARAGVSSKGGLTVKSGVDAIAVAGGQVAELMAEPDGRVCVMSAGRAATLASPVAIDPVDRRQPIQFLHLRPNDTCRMQGYRGGLVLTARDGELRAVNVLSVEEYTAGVVPNEVPAVYPAAALRAMAVIARTFALARRGYHKSRDYDVCGTVDCQMYGGWLSEWDDTNRAVNATRNEVASYEGRPADTTFHAVCGGVGECVSRVWPQPQLPYLVGGPDGPAPLPDLSSDEAIAAFLDQPPDCFCKTSPRFRWRESYTLAQLQPLFEKSLPVTLKGAFKSLGTLNDVQVIERSPLGRVMKLAIEGTEGRYVVESDRVRWLWSGGIVGQGGLQSTLFRIMRRPDGALEFSGGGWGHGAGMCQEGAAGMATRGSDHREIIKHYYPGTTVGPLESEAARAAAPAATGGTTADPWVRPPAPKDRPTTSKTTPGGVR